MKIWIIRGKYDAKVMEDYYKEYPYRKTDDYQDGQYLYWTRDSQWKKKELVSIQVNKASASRAFKRAKDQMDYYDRKFIKDIELLEIDIEIPNGE